MIEQPELGSKLLQLRAEQAMTQHELREKSHVSVRTIQRIESGAVTPRASTLKILIEALGENPDDWFNPTGVIVENKSLIKSLKSMLLINSSDQNLKNALAPAWIAGAVYLILIILEMGMDLAINDMGMTTLMITSLVILKGLIIVSFFLFLRGFISLGVLFENQLLRIASYISIVIVTLMYCFDIMSILLFKNYLEVPELINALLTLPFGAISIVFGIALIRLQDGIGKISKIAGRIEIVFGISYLTLIFSFVGLILLAPLLVVEIVLLSKADHLGREGLI